MSVLCRILYVSLMITGQPVDQSKADSQNVVSDLPVVLNQSLSQTVTELLTKNFCGSCKSLQQDFTILLTRDHDLYLPNPFS
jgi:hypothetical protein